MATSIRPIGYTNSVQSLTVYPLNRGAQITAYLWGGGGGGGGSDSQTGGSGTGGGLSIVKFGCSKGDNLLLAVGGGGGSGRSGASAVGGSGGSSYIGYSVFNTRDLAGSNGIKSVSLSYSWSNFMNAYAVWNTNNSATFDVSTSITVPFTGVYIIQTAFDNNGTVYIDGVAVASSSDTYPSSVTNNISLNGGNHTLRIVANNSGSPAGAAVVINSGTSYSGAPGGNSGPVGGSGSGGGGGGSTLLVQNNSLQAVAAGGGGGGGAGNSGAGGDSPGPHGQTTNGFNGEYGADHPVDGGGGGGGGGGYTGGTGGGGNGGAYGGWPGQSDIGGQAGNPGASWSWSHPSGFDPSGRTPGRDTGIVPPPGIALGGYPGRNGGNGYAVIYMDVPGIFVDANGVYYSTKAVWVNVRGVWKQANSVYINVNGVWSPAAGQDITNFQSISGGWGMVPRSTPYTYVPPLDISDGGTRGGGRDYSEGTEGTFGTLYSGDPSDGDGHSFA